MDLARTETGKQSGTQRSTVVWTIAGFDPSSGAGVTADLMTFAAHGLFGCSAITGLTVQSTLGVAARELVRPVLLAQTLRYLAEDLRPAGIKIGMLGGAAQCSVVAEFIAWLRAQEQSEQGRVPVVLDPVLRSSSGLELFPDTDLPVLHAELLPQLDCITPNWEELAALTGSQVNTLRAAEGAARALIAEYPGLNVIATGGDQAKPTDLLTAPTGGVTRFEAGRVETSSTHGTGCAFSSAVLANLVTGLTMGQAVRRAKDYVREALRQAPGIGGGKGPLGLLWPLRRF